MTRTTCVRGYLVTVNGRSVLIQRVIPAARDRREFGLTWRAYWVVQDADVFKTLREAVAEARALVRAEHHSGTAAGRKGAVTSWVS